MPNVKKRATTSGFRMKNLPSKNVPTANIVGSIKETKICTKAFQGIFQNNAFPIIEMMPQRQDAGIEQISHKCGNLLLSAEGAPYTSLGRRPRLLVPKNQRGLKARPIR